MAFWCLFDFFQREVSCINIVLEYSSLKAISEKLSKTKALLNY